MSYAYKGAEQEIHKCCWSCDYSFMHERTLFCNNRNSPCYAQCVLSLGHCEHWVDQQGVQVVAP